MFQKFYKNLNFTCGKYSSSHSLINSISLPAMEDIKLGSNENIIELINKPLKKNDMWIKLLVENFCDSFVQMFTWLFYYRLKLDYTCRIFLAGNQWSDCCRHIEISNLMQASITLRRSWNRCFGLWVAFWLDPVWPFNYCKKFCVLFT